MKEETWNKLQEFLKMPQWWDLELFLI